jgi:hypothetical protein
MRNKNILPVGLSLVLVACAGSPVTDGFRSDLPRPGTRTIVWGDDVSTVAVATTWLQKRGLSVIERSALVQHLDPEAEEMARALDLSHTLKDEAAVLRAAGKAGAQQVVFVDRGGDARAPMVSVRGLTPESGAINWSGSARYPTLESRPSKHALANLTCEALATAWQFRPPGSKWLISSERMCEVENPASQGK